MIIIICSLAVVCSDLFLSVFLFFKQKTAYEMRISDWSSDVALPICSTNRRGKRFVELLIAARAWQADLIVVGGTSRIEEPDRKSVVKGKSVSVRVALGGSRININKKPNVNATI